MPCCRRWPDHSNTSRVLCWKRPAKSCTPSVKGIIPALLAALAVLAVTTAFGAGAGAIIGFFAGVVGAGPGAAVGAGVGFDAGLSLLEVLGLGFLVAYIGTSLLNAMEKSVHAAEEAWVSVDHRELKDRLIDAAAHQFAEAVALVFRGVLQGIVAFLLAKGSAAAASRVGELIAQLRNSKIGAGFADWIESNWRRLIDEPKLKGEKSAGGAGAAEEGGVLAILRQSGDARRAQAYQDIDAYQQKYQALETQARSAGGHSGCRRVQSPGYGSDWGTGRRPVHGTEQSGFRYGPRFHAWQGIRSALYEVRPCR